MIMDSRKTSQVTCVCYERDKHYLIVDKLTFERKVLTVIYMPMHVCIWQLRKEVLDWTELEMD